MDKTCRVIFLGGAHHLEEITTTLNTQHNQIYTNSVLWR